MREKLIELLEVGLDKIDRGSLPWAVEMLADHLIAHGVTIQRWRSVTDEPPNEGEMILVCAGGEVGEGFRSYTGFHWANGFPIESEVTHWMPLPKAWNRRATDVSRFSEDLSDGALE